METFRECVFELDKFLYAIEEDDSLFAVQEKFLVPMHRLVSDNLLSVKPVFGRYIFIDRTQGETTRLLPDKDFDFSAASEKNGSNIFYPFQLIYK